MYEDDDIQADKKVSWFRHWLRDKLIRFLDLEVVRGPMGPPGAIGMAGQAGRDAAYTMFMGEATAAPISNDNGVALHDWESKILETLNCTNAELEHIYVMERDAQGVLHVTVKATDISPTSRIRVILHLASADGEREYHAA